MPFRALNIVSIDLDAVRRNVRALGRLHKSGAAGLMPVVKSDAYGHGMTEVARVLVSEGVWGLAVFDVPEAEALRSAGIGGRIFLLSGFAPGDEDAVIDLDLIPGITRPSMLDFLETAASKRGVTCDVHLKVNTGMGRMGLEPDELSSLVGHLGKWPHLHITGLYSHLSSADEPGDPLNHRQLRVFHEAAAALEKLGLHPFHLHIANSAGLVNFPQARFALARPGIAVYGAYPGDEARRHIDLAPVMRFSSRVVQARDLPAGVPVGYGHRFVTGRPSRIAVVPVGYDDGYPRALSGSAQVLVRGRRVPVAGNICMKAIMVDVTDLPEVGQDEEVVLLGAQGGEAISPEEIAGWAGTISYEVLCLLGSRNTRQFKGDATCSE